MRESRGAGELMSRQSEIDTVKEKMKDFLGDCSCHPAYKDRKRIDPRCAWCNYGECGAEHLVDVEIGTAKRFEIDGDFKSMSMKRRISAQLSIKAIDYKGEITHV